MIDLKHEAGNFAPMNIPEGSPEDIRWAYSLYNKALQYIKKGYADLARQNLKKAIGLNPDFYPARMLLGVCLFDNGDRVGAMRMFNAIKDMRYKRLALSYYDYLAEEIEKTPAHSGQRLILKDLYKAAAAAEKTLKDVTEPTENPLQPVEPEEDTEDYESLTMGRIDSGNTEEEELSEEEKKPVINPEDDIEVPFFVAKKTDNLITSRKNDGVVEEIVKQKMEEAQKVAKYSGSEKRPFEYEEIYKKQVFGEDSSENTEGDLQETEEKSEATVPSSNNNILISVASVIVLIFIIITSVLLMHNITENRKLKNEVDNLKKLYIESQITPTPKAPGEYTFQVTPEPTPEVSPEITGN